jgi:hypothetical protein
MASGESMRGVQTFVGRSAGTAVEPQSGFDGAWSSGGGGYVPSDQPGFDPNTVFTDRSWTRMERCP